MLARLRPPNALRSRICWIMLVVSLWVMASTVPGVVFGTHAAPLHRALAGIGLAWLAWSELRAYRRGRFRPAEQVLQALAIGVIASSVDDFRSATGLFFVPLFFRCMYGSVWQVVFTVGCWLAAYV